MLLYTALGDSITAGEGATGPEFAYPSRVISMLDSRGALAYGEVLAHPGWTSEALELAIFENPSIYLREAKVISIWVGGDDLADAALSILRGAPKRTLETAIARYGRDLATMVYGIRRVSRAPIILCNQYNPFPNSTMAVEGIGALNAVTAGVASRLNTLLAPTQAWFAGRQSELIAGYRTGTLRDVMVSPSAPVHPNNRGHSVIAENLAPMIQSVMR